VTGRVTRRALLAGAGAVALTGCASKFRSYDGPEVTRAIVLKRDRRMLLLHHDAVLRDYTVGLGFAPQGHKVMRGDGRTPEGSYVVDRRNPRSDFHLSVGISYPDAADIAAARARGVDPGGDIFIHGTPNGVRPPPRGDWTAGGIAVTNREVEDVYAMLRDRTPVLILA